MEGILLDIRGLSFIQDRFPNKDYLSIDDLLADYEDAFNEIEDLKEKIEDLEKDIEDNYKPIPITEQLGISESDFY
jgi:peptidoglycan hydrolase CwlO-like protein